MKKGIAAGMACVLLASLLTSCGPSAPSQSSASPASASLASEEKQESTAEEGNDGEPVELRFYKAGLNQAEHDYWTGLIDRYCEENSNVSIEFAEAQWGEDIETKLTTTFASGITVDLIGQAIAQMATRVSKDQVIPLDSYLEQWDGLSDMNESILEAARYEGKIYAMPYYPEVMLYAYRKDLFEEAGLDPDNPPTNWEELREAAKKLTVYDGDMVTRSGFQLVTQGYALGFYGFYYQNGGVWEDENHNPVWNNQEFRDTMQYMQDLYKTDKVSSDLTVSQFQQQHPFLTGAAAISMIDPLNAKAFIEMDPANADKIGFLRVEEKQGGTHAGINFLYIGKGSKHEDIAWDFIQTAMTKEEMWNRYLQTGCPTVRKSLQTQFIEDNPLVNEAVQYGIDVGQGLPKNDWFITFGDKYLIQIMLQELFYSDKTVDQIVDDGWRDFCAETGYEP